MIGTLLGVLGIVLAVIFYLKAKQINRINYQTSNLKIIGNISLKLPTDFEVMLSGQKIESLHKSQIIIWNGGTSTLHGKDIVLDDPLRVVFDEKTKIFDVSVAGLSREVNKFETLVEDSRGNEVKLAFDFLDRNDGILLEILHTESTVEPKVFGTVKGLTDGINNKGRVEYIKVDQNKSWKNIAFGIGFPLLFAMILGLMLMSLNETLKEVLNELTYLQAYSSIVTGFFIPLIIIVNASVIIRKKFPRSIKFKK